MPSKNKHKDKKIKLSFEEQHKVLAEFCSGSTLSLQELKEKLKACHENLDCVLKAHGTKGTLLHHVVCNEKVTLEMVKYLVGLYPEAVEVVTDYGCLPAHRACSSFSCPKEVIMHLVERYPSGLKVSWTYRGTPLHCYVGRCNITRTEKPGNFDEQDHVPLDLDLVRWLVSKNPKALTNQDNKGNNTPLSLACMRPDASKELIEALEGHESECLRIRCGDHRDTPLSQCFRSYHPLPVDVIQYIIDQAPDTILQANNDNQSSFIVACRKSGRLTLEVAKIFHQAQPDIFGHMDCIGGLPLHNLCCHGGQLETIQYALEAFPAAVYVANRYGFRPIQYAIGHSLEATKLLAEWFPEGMEYRSVDGEPFLHSASGKGTWETFMFIYNLSPESVSRKGRDSNFPLHRAARSNDGADVKLKKIRFLLEQFHEAISMPNNMNHLPLHRACLSCEKQDLQVYQELLEAYPEAIHKADVDGRLPLHLLLMDSFSGGPEVIKFFVQQLPYSIKAKDEHGKLPAHYALSGSCFHAMEIVKCLFTLYPEAAKVSVETDGLPIHNACDAHFGLDVVKYLVSLYPGSLDVEHHERGLPLTCARDPDVFEYLLKRRYKRLLNRGVLPAFAILNDKKLKHRAATVRRLLNHCPGHALDVDYHTGSSVLHSAVKGVADHALVDLLLEKKDLVHKRNKQGELPLHIAVREASNTEISLSLLSVYPGGSIVQDKQGKTPVHVACRSGASLLVINRLLEADTAKNALRIKDKNGQIPLHVACRHGMPLEVVADMVDADEGTVEILDQHGETPLHKACRGGRLELVKFLMRRYMPAAARQNFRGAPPVVLLSQEKAWRRAALSDADGDSGEDDPDVLFVETLWELLRLHPEVAMVHD